MDQAPEVTIHEMTPDAASKTVRECLCSDCWGQLTAHYNPRTRASVVRCSTPGCPCHGFRSRAGVERQEEAARLDKIEAVQTLAKVIPGLPKPAEKDLLKSLGF